MGGRDSELAEGKVRCWVGGGGSMSHQGVDMLVTTLRWDGHRRTPMTGGGDDEMVVVEGEIEAALECLQTWNKENLKIIIDYGLKLVRHQSGSLVRTYRDILLADKENTAMVQSEVRKERAGLHRCLPVATSSFLFRFWTFLASGIRLAAT